MKLNPRVIGHVTTVDSISAAVPAVATEEVAMTIVAMFGNHPNLVGSSQFSICAEGHVSNDLSM